MEKNKPTEYDKTRLRWCTQQADSLRISLKVQPRASKNKLFLPEDNNTEFVKITITAPPVDSEANNKLIDFLSDILDIPKSSIQIVKGHTSKIKLVAIFGITIDEFIR
ncbi:MAG: DUF167 domain-containing protein, partial [Verrucomicrobiia bacterium]